MLKWRESDSTVIAATHGRGLYSFSFSQIQNNCSDIVEVTSNPASGTFQAQSQVYSNDNGPVSINSAAVFKAGDHILLNPQFCVNAGATFEAIIEDCQ